MKVITDIAGFGGLVAFGFGLVFPDTSLMLSGAVLVGAYIIARAIDRLAVRK